MFLQLTKKKLMLGIALMVAGIFIFIADVERRKKLTFRRGIEFKENLQKINNLKFQASDAIMHSLGFDNFTGNISTSFPVFVTGADSHYYMPSQALIQNLDMTLIPRYPNLKLIFYDFGLTTKEAALMRKYCKCCDVRAFPFDKLPRHVRTLKYYAFKPIAVSLVFQEYGNVLWLDSSIRFRSSNIGQVLKRLEEDNVWFYSSGAKKFEIPLHTRRETFDYFAEDPQTFMNFQEIQANIVAFRNSHFSRVILRQWSACALIKDCISPPGSELRCIGPPKKMTPELIGVCQRFDQSVLNIMLRRLFAHQNVYPMPSCMKLRRHQGSAYFPEELDDALEFDVHRGS